MASNFELEQQSPERSTNESQIISPTHAGHTGRTPTVELGSFQDAYPLPPLSQILPIIRRYFSGFNRAYPLFHEPHFMDMVDSWYEYPSLRDGASWAAISVVLALTLQEAAAEEGPVRSQLVKHHIANAQSMLNTLALRQEDLKGLQVVLGLVILFLGTPHPQPSCVLIATAVKLTHRLKLHVGAGELQGLYDHDEVLQRDRLLWITYIFDRHINLRAGEPYSLQDHDIAIDPLVVDQPSHYTRHSVLDHAEDGEDSRFFALRMQLAQVEGRIYDRIYSVRAHAFTGSQVHENADALRYALSKWQDSIPELYRCSSLTEKTPAVVLKQSSALHQAYFLCVFMMHKVHAKAAQWMQRLVEFSGQYEDEGMLMKQITAPPTKNKNILPLFWSDIVETARMSLRLAQMYSDLDSAALW